MCTSVGLNTTGTPEYSGRLSNDGEQIVITGTLGTIQDFTYNDQVPQQYVTSDLVEWLRDDMGLIDTVEQSHDVVASCDDAAGVV